MIIRIYHLCKRCLHKSKSKLFEIVLQPVELLDSKLFVQQVVGQLPVEQRSKLKEKE